MTTTSKSIVILSTVSLIATCTAAAVACYYCQYHMKSRACDETANNLNTKQQTTTETEDVDKNSPPSAAAMEQSGVDTAISNDETQA